jgi:hypothetical protein
MNKQAVCSKYISNPQKFCVKYCTSYYIINCINETMIGNTDSKKTQNGIFEINTVGKKLEEEN